MLLIDLTASADRQVTYIILGYALKEVILLFLVFSHIVIYYASHY